MRVNEENLQHQLMVEQCQQGNRRAQFELYRTYSKSMFNTCLRMMNDRQAAEDVLQLGFVDVFRNLDQYRADSTVGAWIKRVIVNRCISQIRKKKLETTSMDDSILQIADPEEGNIPLDKAKVKLVQKALEQLAEGYRTVFNLYLLEGYDHAEIAQILGITEGASKSQFSRAKKKIREIIEKVD